MTFSSIDTAQAWATANSRHIYVEVEGAAGVLEVYPGGRKIFVAADKGKIYERWRKRLTPDSEFRHCFVWRCREPECGKTYIEYAAHISHVVNAHGGLTGIVHAKREGKEQSR